MEETPIETAESEETEASNVEEETNAISQQEERIDDDNNNNNDQNNKDSPIISTSPESKASPSVITSLDLKNLRQELQLSLQEEDHVLQKQMELLIQRKELVCKVEIAEMDERIAKVSGQQEKMNQKKLRMQLEGMYF
jgi:hypothetical protein